MEPVPTFDPYAELEVSRTATTPTIDAAWRSLLKRNHPDIGGPGAAERTVRLNIAHDWLSDPVRRARYDETREQAGQQRAEASTAPERERRRSAAGPAPASARPAASSTTASRPSATRPASAGPAPSRPASTRAGATRPMVGRQAHRQDRRGIRGRWRALLVVVAALAAVGVLRVLLVAPSPSVVQRAGITQPPGATTSSHGGLLAAGSTTQGSIAQGTPGTTTEPPGRSPAASESVPALSLSGGGDHPATRRQLAGGTYRVDYVVSSPAGDSCPWAIYLTDSAGLDLLMASAYPVDETVRGTQRDSAIVPGSAAIRVESTCPRWSAVITRTGP